MNISSVIVYAKSQDLKQVIDQIVETDNCEYHFHSDEGKIIVTIEGDSVDDEIRALKSLQQIPGVLSAEMVYAYSEDELDREREKLQSETGIPDWLNKNDVDLREIKYGGDLRGKAL